MMAQTVVRVRVCVFNLLRSAAHVTSHRTEIAAAAATSHSMPIHDCNVDIAISHYIARALLCAGAVSNSHRRRRSCLRCDCRLRALCRTASQPKGKGVLCVRLLLLLLLRTKDLLLSEIPSICLVSTCIELFCRAPASTVYYSFCERFFCVCVRVQMPSIDCSHLPVSCACAFVHAANGNG